MTTSESCMYSLELCFQICNSIEHYISLERKTFTQFYNPFQIQEFYKAMSFLHVFSASLEKKKNEMKAELYLFPVVLFVMLHKVALLSWCVKS